MADQERKATLVLDLSTDEGVREAQRFGQALLDAANDAETASERAGAGLDDLDRKLEQMNRREAFQMLRDGLREVVSGTREILSGLDDTTAEAAEFARTVETWAAAVGATVSEMEALGGVGRTVVGGLFDDVGDVGDLMRELGDRATEAATGNAEYQATFEALGVSVVNADGTMRDTADLFIEVNDALATMSDTTLAMTIGGNLLTDVGRSWIANLREQGTTLSALLAEEEKHVLLTDENRQGLDRYVTAQRELQRAQRELDMVIATTSAPTVARFTDAFADLLNAVSDTNPALATFLGLAGRHTGEWIQLAGAIGQVALALKAFGGASAVAAAGRAGGAVLAVGGLAVGAGLLAQIPGVIVEQMQQGKSFAEAWQVYRERFAEKIDELTHGVEPADAGAVTGAAAGSSSGAPPNWGRGMPSPTLGDLGADSAAAAAEDARRRAEEERQRKERAAQAMAQIARDELQMLVQMAQEVGDYRDQIAAAEMLLFFDEEAAVASAKQAGATPEAIDRLRETFQSRRDLEAIRLNRTREAELERRQQAARQELIAGARGDVRVAELRLELLDGSRGESASLAEVVAAYERYESALVQTGAALEEVLDVQLRLKRLREDEQRGPDWLASQLVMASGNQAAVFDVLAALGPSRMQSATSGGLLAGTLSGAVGRDEQQALIQAIGEYAVRQVFSGLVEVAGEMQGGVGP